MKYYKKVLVIALITGVSIAANIDLNTPLNYSNQFIPNYITKDNTPPNNSISDLGATLGRVLFYDKKLSLDQTISCASCHKQEFAFGDTAVQSVGINGETGRHSMRLINTRFSDEVRFFWDERASTLEEQTTMPIQDHIEMGFSGTNGNPDIDSMISRLEGISYYKDLFEASFGDTVITEQRIQFALAQFVRSIQSFDSKFDEGRAQVNNDQDPFPNYTSSENNGKTIFLNPPPLGGAGCAGCHRPPEFDIDPNSMNNGVIGVAGSPGATDFTNTKAPTLRDIVNSNGDLNGPLMHDGSITSLMDLIEHYNQVPFNGNIDPRLQGPGGNLQLSSTEKQDLINFLLTLAGNDVYTDARWSDPFDSNGDIDVTPLLNASSFEMIQSNIQIFPNPGSTWMQINTTDKLEELVVYNNRGQIVYTTSQINQQLRIDASLWESGIYLIHLKGAGNNHVKKWVKK